MKALLTFAASLMGLVLFGAFAAFGGAAGEDDAPKKKGLVLNAAIWAVVPDAYALVPGTQVDASVIQGPAGPSNKLSEFSVECAATVFGATFKVQGSNDKVNWLDLTGADQKGTAEAIDVAVAVNAVGAITFTSAAGGVGGAPGLAFRFYQVLAKNTVGASVASVAVSIFAE